MKRVRKKFILIYLLPALLFAFISSILILSWFRYGLLYGGGDVGLPSYDAKRILDITKYIWWEASAPGNTIPHGLTSVPLQFFQSLLQEIGLTYVATQAILFWIILFLSGYGMFLLGVSIFGKEKIILAILSGLFYILNPYMMIQIWHRFIHAAFFLAALLPYIFLFWRGWLQKGKYLFLLLFLLANFLGVYLYGTLAFAVTIMILLFSIAIVEILFPWKGLRNLKIMSARCIIGLVTWIVIHSWWLMPSFNVAPSVFSKQHNLGDSLTTLLSISEQAKIPYSLIGVNPFYLYQKLDFGNIYESYLFRLLPWLSLIFLIPGFIRALRDKKTIIWPLLFTAGILLSKGTASPFGYIYILAFSHFFFLGALRNPFEKLGILLPFTASILLVLGIEWYLIYAKVKFKRLLQAGIGLVVILLVVVNVWPVWFGKIFGKLERPAFVQVPKSYIDADKFIRERNEQSSYSNKTGKILHLPLSAGEASTYFWQYGYNGVEPSQLLFNSLPSISHGFNLDYVDDALTALSSSFSFVSINEKKIVELLQAFNVRFIVLHKDQEWRGGYLRDPRELEQILDTLSFLSGKAEFGDLIVYQLKDEFFIPKLKFVTDTQYLMPSEENWLWPWLIKENDGDILYPINSNYKEQLKSHSNELVVLPEHIYSYIPHVVAKENAINELPAVRVLPGSPLYPFIKLKEGIQLFTAPEVDRFIFQMTLAGKRLVEAYHIKDKNLKLSIEPQLLAYQYLISKLQAGVIARRGTGLAGGTIPLESIFARHLIILEDLIERANQDEEIEVLNTKNKLIEMLKTSNLIPYYQIEESDQLPKTNRLVARFKIPLDGRYELIMAHQNSQAVYPNQLDQVNFQIDDKIKEFPAQVKENFLSFGFIDLTEGMHEISMHSQSSKNLINLPDMKKAGNIEILDKEIAVTSLQHDPGYIEFDIKPVTGGGWYQLTFESWIRLGDKFRVQLLQDSDPPDPDSEIELLYSFNKEFLREPYNNFWNGYSFNLHLRPSTTKTSIRFLVEPWDDCRIVLVKKILCKDKKVRFPFEHPSTALFKDIKLERLLKNPVFLRTQLPKEKISSQSAQSISFIQTSPISYYGKIKVDKEGFLVFSETFHPDWELTLKDDKKTFNLSPNFIANLYSNAWYINSPGNYSFTLEFSPQGLVRIGIAISIIGSIGIIVLTIWQKVKR